MKLKTVFLPAVCFAATLTTSQAQIPIPIPVEALVRFAASCGVITQLNHLWLLLTDYSEYRFDTGVYSYDSSYEYHYFGAWQKTWRSQWTDTGDNRTIRYSSRTVDSMGNTFIDVSPFQHEIENRSFDCKRLSGTNVVEQTTLYVHSTLWLEHVMLRWPTQSVNLPPDWLRPDVGWDYDVPVTGCNQNPLLNQLFVGRYTVVAYHRRVGVELPALNFTVTDMAAGQRR